MLIVINNFIDNLDGHFHAVKAHVDKLKYYSDTELNDGTRFAGRRTQNVIGQFPRINQQLSETFRDVEWLKIQCHKHTGNPDRVLTHMHKDEFHYAGVIYLRGGQGCGTVVGDNVIGFKQNRLVFYDAQIPHRPQGFPVDRMTISFFGRKR